ncbi:hypothetical protein GCM10010964_00350 [Caldovatus sediminis]|uniref:Flagellar FliJ protein n=1 Tax=Caldovatus sediminis TaxID=2041189 RepID=A0A8J3EAQ4_9PROT|nr:hypothetical protein [Caldovatus sediminis]GGG15958.1 hypothetical protein GCM10010964_00350 [Caldovatus sediminis]
MRGDEGGAGAALVALLRLRRFETAVARRRLAERVGAAAAAEARRDAALEALQAEAAIAAASEDGAAHHAAWLPRGLAGRDRAAAALRLEEERLEGARADLAAARRAERAVEVLAQERAAAARRRAARRAQERLDEMAAAAAARRIAAPRT